MAPRKKSRRIAFVGAGVLVVVVLLDFFLRDILPDSSIRQLLMLAACNVIVALSLNVINGMAGQFSIGHAGFVGIGGYTSAVIASNLHAALGGGDTSFGRSFLVVPVCLLGSATLAGIFGFLVGLPSLRLKGDYLAIVTLGFAEIFRLVIATANAGSDASGIGGALSKLGGQNGYQGIENQGVPLYAGPFWVFGLAFLLGVVAWRIKFSGWGRALRALREDDIAAAAVGVDPTRYKVTSFVIAAVGAGIAGGLMGIMRDGTPVVNPDSYNFQASFDAITMVILGGSGSVSGAAIGGVFITFSIKAIELLQSTDIVQRLRRLSDAVGDGSAPILVRIGALVFHDLNALRMIIYAMVLVGLMIMRPEGLLGERELFQKKRAKG
ncbi:MAG: branched-chain amino acid ABC transporter permease [Labilithrix sp.]|nr:branched-chain amino acid ABC transporter permease [Labilithrix sp.]